MRNLSPVIAILFLLSSYSCFCKNLIRIKLEQFPHLNQHENSNNSTLSLEQLNNPPLSVSSSSRGSTNQQLIQPSNGNLFYSQITIGFPSKSFFVVFSTGSSSLWIPSSSGNNIPPNFSNRYDSSASTTYRDANIPDTESYENGYISGEIVTDYVEVGSNLSTVAMNFLLANSIENLNNFHADGVFGLAMNPPAIYGSTYSTSSTYVKQLVEMNVIQSAVFSFYFGSSTSSSPSSSSQSTSKSMDPELTIGGFDSSRLLDSTKINYHQLSAPYQSGLNFSQLWTINGFLMQIGGWNSMIFATLIDTGSPYIKIRPDAYQKLMNYLITEYESYASITVDGQLFFSVSCSSQLPDFIVTLNMDSGKLVTYTIPMSYYTRAAGNDQCQLLITETNESGYVAVLGLPFLSKYVSIFDESRLMIGFAEGVKEAMEDNLFWVGVMFAVSAVILGIFLILLLRMCHKSKAMEKYKQLHEIRANLLYQYQFGNAAADENPQNE